MCGVRDYVLGLEPGNCNPDGRDIVRRQGKLQMLEPGQSRDFEVHVCMIGSSKEWEAVQGKKT